MKNICVLGLGYIGLPTAAILATNGYRVTGVDINKEIVCTINSAQVHIDEPGLMTVVEAAVKSGQLIAENKPVRADAFIISVPTPFKKNKKADLSFVLAACRSIRGLLEKSNLVILESTCPPGTTEQCARVLEKSGLKAGKDFYLAHCPERVLPGKILKEIIANSRIIGGLNRSSAEKAKGLYRTFVEGEIYLTDATTAEFVKIVENTYRDVNIAFANELSRLCQRQGINVWEVVELANKHPRVNIHSPGPGVGGHCISVDPWFLVEKYKEAKLIKLARQVNDQQPQKVVEIICRLLAKVKRPKVAIFGVSYKADVDDTRESPAYPVIAALLKRGIKVVMHDPIAKNFKYPCVSQEQALKGADCLLLLVNHAVFRAVSPKIAAGKMSHKLVVDTRKFFDLNQWEKFGFVTKLLGAGED